MSKGSANFNKGAVDYSVKLCFADFEDFIYFVKFFTIAHITMWSELQHLTDKDPDLVII